MLNQKYNVIEIGTNGCCHKYFSIIIHKNTNECRMILTMLDVLKEMVLNFQAESLNTIIPVLLHYHTAVQESSIPSKTKRQKSPWQYINLM